MPLLFELLKAEGAFLQERETLRNERNSRAKNKIHAFNLSNSISKFFPILPIPIHQIAISKISKRRVRKIRQYITVLRSMVRKKKRSFDHALEFSNALLARDLTGFIKDNSKSRGEKNKARDVSQFSSLHSSPPFVCLYATRLIHKIRV